jgi:hypothetical protein
VLIMKSDVSSSMSQTVLTVTMLTTEGGATAVKMPSEGIHCDCSRLPAECDFSFNSCFEMCLTC